VLYQSCAHSWLTQCTRTPTALQWTLLTHSLTSAALYVLQVLYQWPFRRHPPSRLVQRLKQRAPSPVHAVHSSHCGVSLVCTAGLVFEPKHLPPARFDTLVVWLRSRGYDCVDGLVRARRAGLAKGNCSGRGGSSTWLRLTAPPAPPPLPRTPPPPSPSPSPSASPVSGTRLVSDAFSEARSEDASTNTASGSSEVKASQAGSSSKVKSSHVGGSSAMSNGVLIAVALIAVGAIVSDHVVVALFGFVKSLLRKLPTYDFHGDRQDPQPRTHH
jgi:hypothetical protein